MIDYESYNKIIQYLDKGDLNKLRLYVEKEKEKTYLKNARTALPSYLVSNLGIGYLDDGKIFLSDGYSLYVLNSDEILTSKQKESQKTMSMRNLVFLLNELENYEKRQYAVVGDIKNPVPSEKQVFSEDGSTYHFFSQRSFNYSKKFLGENVLYKICTDKPICLAESEKGKGLILGLRK